METISRRKFLINTTMATAATLAGLQSGAGQAPYARILGANDDIRLAVVGIGSNVKIGGKGKQDIREWRKVPGVRIVALCDVDKDILDAEVEQFRLRNEKVEAYTDIRKLLENKDIDAISITTPNHWHALMAIWACQAGKDVFLQKPASHNIFEGRKMVEAARKYKRVMQCTSTARSGGIKEALDFARQGGLGKVKYIHGVNYKPRMSIGKVSEPTPIPKNLDYDLWSGPAPVLPVNREYLHYDWHWDFNYGNGDLGNMGIHFLDGCRMATGQGMPPNVISLGGRFGYDDDGETPNSLFTFYDYKPAPVIFEVRGLPKDKSYLSTQWDKNANLSMDSLNGLRTGVIVYCENGYVANNKAYDLAGKLVQEFSPEGEGMYANFIKTMRTRKVKELEGDILEGHLSAGLIHMANISYRIGKTATPGEINERMSGHKVSVDTLENFQEHLAVNGIDLNKTRATMGPMLTLNADTERFTGEFSKEANQLVSRNYRAPFVVPEKV